MNVGIGVMRGGGFVQVDVKLIVTLNVVLQQVL